MKSLRSFIAAAGIASALALPTLASAQSSASPYTTAVRYDEVGRTVGTIAPDPDGSGPLKHAATRTTYDLRGNATKVETGELSSWKSESIMPKDWTGFTVLSTAESTYDNLNRKLTDRVKGSNGVTISLTQYSYDNRGRLQCTAVRMNPARFNNLPSSACTLGVEGSQGPDRITRTTYDAASQVIKVEKAVGTSVQITDVMYSYTPNGKIENVVDANGNRAKYIYDAHDRLNKWHFPNKTRPSNFNPNASSVASSGASTPAWNDYEHYGYDANGNRTWLRKRNGVTLSFEYDALNRMTKKVLPDNPSQVPGLSGLHTRDIFYEYDLRGLTTAARLWTGHGERGVFYTYDGFGRLLQERQTMDDGNSRSVSSVYDKNGNRTRITYPDGRYFNQVFDGLNRLDTIRNQWGTTLIDMSYNNRGLPSQNNRWSTTPDQTYSYDPAGRLGALGWSNAGAQSVTWNYTRNPASQIASETQSNDSYSWNGHVNVNRPYTTNGLNQYTNAGGASFTYDDNGNLTSDGSKTYQYDLENRLVKVTGGGRTTELFYDPLGRLYRLEDSQTGQTNFIYDNNALIAEYNAAGSLIYRHVHGSNVDSDDPLLTYNGTDMSSHNVRHLYADPRGSIVYVANRAQTTTAINTYDEYGIPDTASGNDLATKGRFRYTGQAWIPELGMYYYKARIYSPTLGRFLQTDPIGYEDQYNLYAYVGNDPINGVDPTGLEEDEVEFEIPQLVGEVKVTYSDSGITIKVDNPFYSAEATAGDDGASIAASSGPVGVQARADSDGASLSGRAGAVSGSASANDSGARLTGRVGNVSGTASATADDARVAVSISDGERINEETGVDDDTQRRYGREVVQGDPTGTSGIVLSAAGAAAFVTKQYRKAKKYFGW